MNANSLPPNTATPLYSAAAERNQRPILQALQRWLPAHGQALEIASGTGQHVAFFATHMPGWQWQPTDVDCQGFDSVAAWCAQASLSNVLTPRLLDVQAPRWPSAVAPFHQPFDAIFCANMLHISHWATCAALMQGVAHHLAPQGQLILYGPYLEANVPTSPGNLAFDASLRQRNPAWGLRSLDDVLEQAALAEMQLTQRLDMPAHNLLLAFEPIAPFHYQSQRAHIS